MDDPELKEILTTIRAKQHTADCVIMHIGDESRARSMLEDMSNGLTNAADRLQKWIENHPTP